MKTDLLKNSEWILKSFGFSSQNSSIILAKALLVLGSFFNYVDQIFSHLYLPASSCLRVLWTTSVLYITNVNWSYLSTFSSSLWLHPLSKAWFWRHVWLFWNIPQPHWRILHCFPRLQPGRLWEDPQPWLKQTYLQEEEQISFRTH